RTRQDFVDRPGAREVPAHRLLHDDAGDRSLARVGYEPGRLELVDAGGDQARRDRQIEDAVPGYAELGLDLFEPALELRVRLRVGEGARRVEQRASVLGPVRVRDRTARESLDPVAGERGERRVVQFVAGEPDDGEVGGQHAIERQVVERREQLAGAQVAG